ncbi:MAG TPA: MOSC domain-containing protein [Bryobacteraceae bacterium]|nr:MOSC domain-containing protein [Bryobacteraceae bacterium]
MQVISVNVGQPREVETLRGIVLTSIFKSPVSGRVAVRNHNLEGDRQADLRVHGGPNKAIYAYSSEHYSYWAKRLPDTELPYGKFGENLTIAGLTEEQAHIGDSYRIGTCILRVTQPRMPCFKLALRFERTDMIKLFWKSGLSGTYFAIAKEGELGAEDDIELVEKHPAQVAIADVVKVYKRETTDPEIYARVMQAPISGSWKEEIRERWAQMMLTDAE